MALLSTLKTRFFSGGKPVELMIYVPPETPTGEAVYLSGACEKLGAWNPAGLKLRRIDDGVWRAKVSVPADQPLEFKVTRGSWETVERAADGADRSNIWIDPQALDDGVVRHRVERWSDAG